MRKYSYVCTIRSAAKLENGCDISGTILIKFLIKSNSVSFKGHFPYPRCIASFSSRIETKSFPSSFLLAKKNTPLPASITLLVRDSLVKPTVSMVDESSETVLLDLCSPFRPSASGIHARTTPGALLIIYPGRSWITPTVGRTQLINSPVTIHLALSRPRVFHGPVSFLPLSLQL